MAAGSRAGIAEVAVRGGDYGTRTIKSGGAGMVRMIALGLTAAGLLALSGPAFAADCARLASLQLPHAKITLAEMRPAGPFAFGDPKPTQPPNRAATVLPAFCRVVGVIEPAIGFEVWMPANGWNGRFIGVGDHEFAGSIPYSDMAMVMAGGAAVAGTDTGHVGRSAAWMSDHQKLIDYGYRGIHEMTTKAKLVVDAFYGDQPKYSYFYGCSTGGKQGLTEAQRYPKDYNGIFVSDPNNSQSGNRAQYVWMAQATFAKPETTIPVAKLMVLHKAVMAACDAADGLKDGVIADPTRCRFDPAVLQCKAGEDAAACLTAPQVEAVRKIYQGPRNPRTGAEVYPGMAKGSEYRWGLFVSGPRLFPTAIQFFGNIVFHDAKWDYRSFDFDHDLDKVAKTAAPIVDAVDPDLSAFAAAGGKIVHADGWADVNHTPLYAVEYHKDVEAKMGADRTATFYRLFMQPGGLGCGARFDAFPALTHWVEDGVAPESIVAPSDATPDAPARTRPMCAYPATAHYTGHGSIDEAANFVCR
jgi:feruloyl esterase